MRTTCVWTETFTLNHIRIYYFVFLISICWTIPNVHSGQWVLLNTVLFNQLCLYFFGRTNPLWINIRKLSVIVFPKKVIIQLKAMAFDPIIPSNSRIVVIKTKINTKSSFGITFTKMIMYRNVQCSMPNIFMIEPKIGLWWVLLKRNYVKRWIRKHSKAKIQ